MIAAANSIALRRSDNKCNAECRNEFRYNTNGGILEDFIFVCGVIAVLGIQIETESIKAAYTVIHK
jgi:hypothetical protein